MSVNNATVIGNLGADPQVRTLPSGTKVANLSVATHERFTDRQGAKQQRTDWHRVVVFGKAAENCEQYLGKGRQVCVEGRLTTRSYEAKDGSGTRYRTEIVARRVTFMGRGSNQQPTAQDEAPF